MKGTGKIIFLITIISSFFLVYVHEQILLFEVSYDLSAKSSQYARKSEEYRQLKFQVDQLKAPRLLENEMNQMKLDLTLPKEVHVLKVPPQPVENVVMKSIVSRPMTGNLPHFLGRFIDVAQAKEDK